MSNNEKMRRAVQKVVANLEARDQLVCEMANRWKEDTHLPMNIWIDETKSYVRGRHAKRVKFQLDTSDTLDINKLGSMDLNGQIHEPKTRIRGLSAKDLNQLRNFIRNNRYAIEHIADMTIHVGQIWPDIIKGGEPATEEAINLLNSKVDRLIKEKERASW